MQNLKRLSIALACTVGLVGPLFAQDDANYPKHTPSPKKKATSTPKAATTPAPAAAAATSTPKPASTPLKMIRTDGKNPNSPIKVADLEYYDQGYGATYNSPIRTSCVIFNSSPADEVKKITLSLRIMDGAGTVVQDYTTPVGNLKPSQRFKYEPPLYYNGRGVVLHAEVQVEHEEIPKATKKK